MNDRTRVRITLDFDVDTAKARLAFPDVVMPHEAPIDGIEVYMDTLAILCREEVMSYLPPDVDRSPVHFLTEINPPESKEF